MRWHGPDPVSEWYRGTGLRPVLAALGPVGLAHPLAVVGHELLGLARAGSAARTGRSPVCNHSLTGSGPCSTCR